jgi:cytidylate kinase
VLFTVVTVARTLGAGGEDLGSAIADELGFRYVDSEIIDRAAALAGATPEEIASAEARKGLLGRLLEHLPGSRGDSPASGHEGKHGYEELIREVIAETAAMEYVVIVAHGAGIALAGKPNVLRVMVTASRDTRVERIGPEQGISWEGGEEIVDQSDSERLAFFHRFYGLENEMATNYDLVINTDALTIHEATEAVLALVRGS